MSRRVIIAISLLFLLLGLFWSLPADSLQVDDLNPNPSEVVIDSTGSVQNKNENAETETAGSASSKKVKSLKKRSQKDWSKLTAEQLDKEWEQGDDPELVENEFELQQKLNKKKAVGFDPRKKMNLKKNPFALMGGSSTKMVFVDLKSTQPDGKPWDKKATDKLAGRWQTLIKTGSLTANVFNIEDGKILISVDKSYMFGDVMKFAFNQEETDKISIDSKEYHAKDYKDDIDEDE